MTGSAAPEALLAVGVSHRTAPLALFERLALDPAGAADLLAEVTSKGVVREAVALSTCGRTELYLVASDSARAEDVALAALSLRAGAERETLPRALRSLRGTDAVSHLFRVTAGLESVAVGETEIQGQVKRAYQLALLEGRTGPVTNRLFHGALQAGKRVRSAAGDRRSPPSVASLGVRLAVRRVGELKRRRVVVIGAGENAEATGRALAGHGVRPVFVASRRYARAEALARRFGGRPVGFQGLETELIGADLVFSCTSSQQPIVARQELARVMEERRGRTLLLIDSALPRDLDPAARDLPGIELYDIDDLKREAGRDERATAAPARAGQIIDEEVRRFEAWLASLDVVPAISALRAHAEAAVNHVLDENEARWEALSASDRERIGVVARAVASRLLHEPTMTLKRAAGSEASTAYVRAVHGLLGRGPPAAGEPIDRHARDGRARRAAPSASGPLRGRPAAESTGG
jgi:glutamyl-tRNA reductase